MALLPVPGSQRAPYLEAPGFEIHVLPLEPLELAAPETGGDG